MSENGEIYTAGKNFTLPPALTALTNSNSASVISHDFALKINKEQKNKSPFSHILTFDQLRESSIFSFSFVMPQQMMECNKRSCAT